MRLVGAVSSGSGPVNEDHCGFTGTEQDVTAAWVLDGVTGINDGHLFPAESDARWLVLQANRLLQALGNEALPPAALLRELVAGLCREAKEALGGEAFPAGYDPPAACLLLVKRYADGWQALRLGDSSLLWRRPEGRAIEALVPDSGFDRELAQAAAQQRQGVTDIKALLAAFRPRLLAMRQRRNRPGGYGILEADPAATTMADIRPLGWPAKMLLCSDGYYRAVDHYGLVDPEGLMAASLADGGLDQVLGEIRRAEREDPDCNRFPRFKPADDATAVALA